MLNMCVSGSPNDRAIACANWLDFQTFCENWKNKTNGARTEKNTASWFDLAQLLRGVLQCDVGRLHSSWTSDISSSTAAVTRLFCAEGISPAVFFLAVQKLWTSLESSTRASDEPSVEQGNTDFILITLSNKLGDGLLRRIRLLCDYCFYTVIKGGFAHQRLWGKFDMLHSPMIGIMELISTCYSVQLVRLPLHPQSSPPSPSSMYDNKHCSSGFPHLLVHISFIPYSYFCGHVCRQENAHVCCIFS